MTPFALVLIALASARLTRLVTTDTILDPPRDWLLLRLPTRSKIATLIECNYCTGFWVTLATVLIWHGWGTVGRWVVWVWAAAAVQMIVNAIDSALDSLID